MRISTMENKPLLRFSFAITFLAIGGIFLGWYLGDESFLGMGALMLFLAIASWMGTLKKA